ncbi:hypothetical protein B566_EDAN015311 [Ephemera danica]|nr:hypothetical protein B566_EDAN015311 [Ephemera danica]
MVAVMLAVVAIFLTCLWLLIRRPYHPADQLPGPPTVPFFGNAFMYMKNKRETAMGTTVNAQEKSDSLYVTSIYQIVEQQFYRLRRPWLWPDWIFKLSSPGRKFEKYRRVLHAFTDKGHDTTAMGLSWTLYFLSVHQDVQSRCVEELDEIFSGSDRDVKMADLSKMKYLERVIKESIRLRPPVRNVGRKLHKSIKFDGYEEFPAKTVIAIGIYQVHRNPEIFPDPEKFDPDRFLPENCIGRHPYAYIPFSAGPRNCIGQKFAMLELKSTLSYVLRHFRLESCDPEFYSQEYSSVVLKPLNGIKTRLYTRDMTQQRMCNYNSTHHIFMLCHSQHSHLSDCFVCGESYVVKMDMILLALAVILVTCLWLLIRKPKHPIDQLPGPPTLPFFGNALMYARSNQEGFQALMDNCLKYRPLFRTWLTKFVPVINPISPEHIETILSSTEHIKKSFEYDIMSKFFGNGLVTTEVSKWHSRRKLLTPAFHFNILERYIPVFCEKTRILIAKLESAISANPEGINIVPYITRCALDIICETAMGHAVNAQEGATSEYLSTIQKTEQLIYYRMKRPWLLPDWIFNLTKAGREFDESNKILHDFTDRVRQRFAMLEMKEVISTLLRHFKLESCDPEFYNEAIPRLTLQPMNGVKMDMILPALAVILVTCLWLLIRKPKHPIDQLPGPPTLPFFGNALMYARSNQEGFQALMDNCLKYRPLFRTWLTKFVPVVNPISPEHVETILSSTQHIKKSIEYGALTKFLGNGLVTTEGIDILPYIKRCALDIICETAMGHAVNAQEGTSSEYLSTIQKNDQFDYVLLQVIQKRRNEIKTAQMEDTVTETDDYLGRRKKISFLDLLMNVAAKDPTLTEFDIRSEVDTFMIAGHDTTTYGMSWTVYYLSANPEIQDHCLTELEEIFGTSDRDPTMTDLANMKYIERVIKETMRLRPPAWFIGRQLTKSLKFGKVGLYGMNFPSRY